MSKPRKKQGKVAQARSEIVAELPAACATESAAVEFMEKVRWAGSPVCPRCSDANVYTMTDRKGGRNRRYLWRCRACGEQYTVRTGTVFEDSRIPLTGWAAGFWAACAGKKGVSAKQIERMTGLSYKSALFMMHRIRFAMTPDMPAPKLTGTVEADETYIGGKPRNPSLAKLRARRAEQRRRKLWRLPNPPSNKVPVVAFLARSGDMRAMVMPTVNMSNISKALRENVELSATLMTDEGTHYYRIGREFTDHQRVKHSLHEYVRGECYVNTAESFFARLKRQLHGTHHSVSPRHLHRYVTEAVFKHNTSHLEDGERVLAAIHGAEGKRLRYAEPITQEGAA